MHAGILRDSQRLGVADTDPIFILGLTRSGSTLIEQILASHSEVEGTHELADIQRIVMALRGPGTDVQRPRYPGVLAELGPPDFRKFGERFRAGTRIYRQTQRSFFIDKLPDNFRDIGLIHLSCLMRKSSTPGAHPWPAASAT